MKNVLEHFNPGQPWRILHLNRAIATTRSHNLDLMQRVFDELIDALPADAPQFFRDGMQELVKLDYPTQVREIIQYYFDKCTRPHMH